MRVVVTLRDSTARRWGFEASPRLSSAANSNSAADRAADHGKLELSDAAKTQLYSDNKMQWVAHTSGGTFNNSSTQVTWEFDYTPPATANGNIDFYVAGNAANGNGNSDAGDKVYTSKVTLTPAASMPRPTISSGGVVNAASFTSPIAPGSLFSIFGSNFASGDNSASSLPLPTTLGGVTVKYNGTPIPLVYVGTGQINAQLPYGFSSTSGNIVVSTAAGDSVAVAANLDSAAPGIFTYGSNRAIVVNSDQVTLNSADAPAPIGSFVVAYATGGGAVDNAVATGAAAPTSPLSRVTGTPAVTIDGVPANVTFAGLTPGFVGLLQVNFQIPTGVTPGDRDLVISVAGKPSKSAKIAIR